MKYLPLFLLFVTLVHSATVFPIKSDTLTDELTTPNIFSEKTSKKNTFSSVGQIIFEEPKDEHENLKHHTF